MKLASKIAASVALLGALTVSRAESITFGVEVPPLASLIVQEPRGSGEGRAFIYDLKGLAPAPAPAVAPANP